LRTVIDATAMRATLRAVLAAAGIALFGTIAVASEPERAGSATEPPDTSPASTIAVPSPSATAVPTIGPDVVGRARPFLDARRAQLQGRRDDARRDYAEAARTLPEIADHALFQQARLAHEAGDDDAARTAIDRLLIEHPDSVWRDDAVVDRARLALDAGDANDAASWFARATSADDGATAAAAKLGLAQAEAARGRPAVAYELVDPLRGRAGVGTDARTLGESLEALGPVVLGIAADELALRQARARLREGRAAETRTALAPLLLDGQRLRAEAALIAARSWGKAAPVEAAAAYEVAITTSSAADVAGTALFERAKLAWNRDDDAAADRDFALLVERFPAHQNAAEALAGRARIAEARGDTTTAIALHEQVVARYPDTRFAADSAWRAGFVRWQQGAFADAATAFATLGARDDARYWRARALAAAGDDDAARAELEALRASSPASFYAWWVDERLGAPRTRPDFPRADRRTTRTQPPSLTGAAASHDVRGRVLVAIGLPRDATREYAAVEKVIGPDPYLLDAYRDAGAWDALVRTAIRLQQSGRSGLEESLYPRPFAGEFTRSGAAAGIDPLLLVAMARQESLFDPRATSSAGAHGLLQLLPATAARVAGTPITADGLDDPAQNIDLGARYLASLLARFDGRLVLAVAAYNAGPEAAERWRARKPDGPGDEVVESISYRETREYVKAVLRNYRTYHLLFGGTLPRPRLY
jgi:soluble lytic murein transglycosylase